MIHHDNTSAHYAKFTTKFLRFVGMKLMSHLPYSPDLTPCDFFLFPTIENELRETHPSIQHQRKMLMNLKSMTSGLPVLWNALRGCESMGNKNESALKNNKYYLLLSVFFYPVFRNIQYDPSYVLPSLQLFDVLLVQ